ncbi:HAD family hydrolase [Kineosporia succinea]|uniref:Phosphoglycolate phosphatase n=1 Tax=Kineosporia succinea TaxID=84632 RepID=A0ABT9P1F3_9ACTN|nr:HAD family hydrolase [Kineosporia succinea]MDP9825920.1 phosphoglycolate phosphatase [Kineosporia succinea]
MPSEQLVVGFDLDMTLVDSADGIVATLQRTRQQVLGDAPGPVVDRKRAWPLMGYPLDRIISELMPGADVDLLADTYRSLYPTTGLARNTLLPGVHEAFAAIREAGGRVLVISAKSEPGVHTVLEALGLLDGKHRPDLIAGGRFGVAKGELLAVEGASAYVGDHVGDVAAARFAGAASVGVSTGPQSADELRAAGADVVLEDLLGFPRWLSGHLAGLSRSHVSN